MEVSTLTWTVTLGVTVTILIFDVIIVGRRPHEPTTKECVVAISIYTTLAVLFGAWVWIQYGSDRGTEFYAGWLTAGSTSRRLSSSASSWRWSSGASSLRSARSPSPRSPGSSTSSARS
jgi:hypothetical protein